MDIIPRKFYPRGGSPDLVVMGGVSFSKGREFESWHRILNGSFSHLFVVKMQCVCERMKMDEKEAGVSPFF